MVKSKNKNNTLIEDIVGSINIGIVALTADYAIENINIGFMNMFGYKENEIKNRSIKVLFNLDEYNALEGYIRNAAQSTNISFSSQFELKGMHHDGCIIPLEITIIRNDSDKEKAYILIIRDDSEIKQTVDDLKYLAYYDQLTMLPNETLFRDRAETAIRIAKRDDESLAIMYIDVDKFKAINDTMGHEGGNILLKELSHRFQKCVRESDTVSRIGGDEFTILMLKITCIEDVEIVAKRIIKSNQKPVRINDKNIIPKTSLGISIFPENGDDIDILLKNADAAMYYAKANCNNQYVFYDVSMNAKAH